jgi:hypothetical protein
MGTGVLNTTFGPNQTVVDGVKVPYAGWVQQLTAGGTCQPTVAQALVAYPQYCGALFGENENEGTSMYNSMQLVFQKSFSSGIYVNANYTLSRLTTDAASTTQSGSAGYGGVGAVINPYQGSRNTSLSPDDQTHVFSLLGVYDLPFGPGKKWLTGGGIAGKVIGGWKLSSSIKLTSGSPFYFRDSTVCGVPSQFEAACIPAITGSVLAQSWGSMNVNAPAFNASAFTPTSQFDGTYLGTGPRVSSVRGSPYRDTNLSIGKVFAIKERLNFEFRAEMFNVLNNHYFTCDGQAFGDCIPFNNDPSSPVTYKNGLLNSGFGAWNGTVTQPRNIQLVGRITF